MNSKIRKSTGTVLGFIVAITCGAPAIADDTELLLLTPPDPSEVKPNVLFILDTSGSMDTTQEFGAFYDPLMDYSAFGSCGRDRLYYGDLTGEDPVCDASNTMFVDKAAYQCAASVTAIADVGTHTGVMVQYRIGASGFNEWAELQPGNSTGTVECQADSGIHGDGRDARAGLLYAASGSNMPEAYTGIDTEEIDWTSSGYNTSYKIYDGNYLNYKKDPATQDTSRAEIMQEVTKTVLNSVDNMNVGIMRFNEREGGVVLLAPTDLDTNRASILTTIDSLNPYVWTPLAETLFESALFWQGLPANYGNLNQFTTDPLALSSSDPTRIYKRPDMLSCSKNFNVLVTDGVPREDTDTPGLLGQLPNFATVLNRTGCTTTGDGACLDDIAEYLSKTDIDPSVAGRQSVITHTIGFAEDLPFLRAVAEGSGGQYIQADDADSLTVALTEIVSQINERALTFTAPAVSVNTFNRTRNLNDVYLTMFNARGNAHWPGNLKAYRIEDGAIVDATGANAVDPTTGLFYSTARSFWTAGQSDGNDVLLGGAANQLPDPGARRLFTYNDLDDDLSAVSNAISTGNLPMYSVADFGLASTGTTMTELINWMRGEDLVDPDGDGVFETVIRNAMGDPLHSRPAAVVYGGTETSPQAVIYTATNDGYLHAIDAQNGRELWSYVPKELLPNMARLREDPELKYKLYGLDGDIVPVVRDKDGDGTIEPSDGDFVIIIFGMRRGGSTYRALDVSDKDNPTLLWERVLDEGGQSWSAPAVARVNIADVTQNAFNATVILGGGYDGVHDTAAFNSSPDGVGAGVHMLDLFTGLTVWRAGHTSTYADLLHSDMTRSIPTRINTIDINGDGFADRMYASDLGGQIWRFDIMNGNDRDQLVTGGVFAQLGAEGMTSTPAAADTRRFYNSPDVAMFNDTKQNRRFISVGIGSGYRAHPLDLSADNAFYSLRDPNVFNALSQSEYDALTPLDESDLVDVTGSVEVTITASDSGWMLRLPSSEMILADAATFNNEVFFVSFAPDSSGAAACNVGQGTNYLYRVSILNGDPIVEDFSTILPGFEDAERKDRLAQGGIAPSPQFLFPTPDADCEGGACNPPPLGCIGVECFDPGFANNPVRTLWTQDGIE
jgi:type IV pilus assembly protein PilY1